MKKAALIMATTAALAGCMRVTDDMARQPRHDPGDTSPLFSDGKAERAPPPGSVVHARGDLALVSSGRAGAIDPAAPRPVDSPALLRRGGERYAIYCLPCHGPAGAGDGEVVKRGFPRPPDLAALQGADDARLFAAIRQGSGRMAAFADRVSSDDAWAVVAYLRRLQQKAAR
ncbi:cytochrome c [Paucibacter sp. R3-3]|uniref:Cytochrome c n=1 Tax=Roseateles agri TaxID=3098619 RepID=A0ABU5DNJ7_9BURK|nr:cytochrome c [Paucibacter sp. R3-3]MDY0747714.1 cytochrome c [Paucibacter sp. R3-3]